MPITIISASSSTAGDNLTLGEHDAYFINDGIIVASTEGSALVSSAVDYCDAVINGTVIGNTFGIDFSSTNINSGSSVTISATGKVQGYFDGGLRLDGIGCRLVNHGEVLGVVGAAVFMNGDSTSVVNTGTISTVFGTAGVVMQGADVRLVNSGTIYGPTAGVSVDAAVGALVINSGTIAGDLYSILTSGLDDKVYNSGKLSGLVALGAGSDLFVGTAGSAAVVDGDLGNDTIRGGAFDDSVTGENGADRILGRDGDDALDGGTQADVLNGGAGDDSITGGTGKDVMLGGAGLDVFVFNATNEFSGANAGDRISDFTSRQDKLDFSALDGFTFIGSSAFSSVAGQIRYAKADGQLQFDLDGNGTMDGFLYLQAGKAIAATDFIL